MMNEPFGTSVGDAGFVSQLRLVTLTVALGVADPAPTEILTLTVPLATIAPDQELAVPAPATVLLLESVKRQFENVLPEGALLTLQVTLPPRMRAEGEQLSVMTLTPPLGVFSWRGQVGGRLEPSR